MKMNLFKYLTILTFAKAITSCTSVTKVEDQIANIQVDIHLTTFHKDFAAVSEENLPDLKKEFPMFFPQRIPDSIWISKLKGQDAIHNILVESVKEADFDYNKMEIQLKDVMRHVVYYFPEFEPTPIVTVLSDVNYQQKVIPTSNLFIISIDTYLGKDHELYLGINKYQRENLNIEQLPADAGLAYARLFLPPIMERSLLDNMVYHGKLHYIQELFAPKSLGDQLFSYTPEKYAFTVENESQMWRYFIDNELLYDTDSKLMFRFILPAPFSKFGLEVDQQTPGGVGRYIGYRMVKSFMENNQVDLEAMIQLNAKDIFKRSKYKPLQ
jgi:gliding motility-associated lipoprotein GldB